MYSLMLKYLKIKMWFTCHLIWVCTLSFGLRQNLLGEWKQSANESTGNQQNVEENHELKFFGILVE